MDSSNRIYEITQLSRVKHDCMNISRANFMFRSNFVIRAKMITTPIRERTVLHTHNAYIDKCYAKSTIR